MGAKIQKKSIIQLLFKTLFVIDAKKKSIKKTERQKE